MGISVMVVNFAVFDNIVSHFQYSSKTHTILSREAKQRIFRFTFFVFLVNFLLAGQWTIRKLEELFLLPSSAFRNCRLCEYQLQLQLFLYSLKNRVWKNSNKPAVSLYFITCRAFSCISNLQSPHIQPHCFNL